MLAGMTATFGVEGRAGAAPAKSTRGALPSRPNIVVLITDQERSPQHWPSGWAERHLPIRQRLADRGLTFTNGFCNSAMCSPSRSTLFTGLYPAQHGVVSTLTTGGTLSPSEPVLSPDEQNIGKMLTTAGYDVQYRGKWHMSKGADGGDATTEDVAAFGFAGWQPPEAGQDTNPANFGGGCANHDGRIADEAVEYLRTVDVDNGRPFALVVSFANPHDLLAYPQTWNLQENGCGNYQSAAPGCFEQGISLPPTVTENLAFNFKPTAQVQSQLLLAGALGPLVGQQQLENYANFYGYLQQVVDERIGSVVDAIEARPGLLDETLIVRVSDHGEMGLAHGGLRQKVFNAYEETVRVPIVVSNPVLFPKPVRTDAMATLIDLMPTFATIADVPNRTAWRFLGTDLTPVIDDASANPGSPSVSVQDEHLFTYDDQNPGAPNGQNIVTEPSHIRAIRDSRWKYAMYFDPQGVGEPQYELYDLLEDPLELHNMAVPANVAHYSPGQVSVMAAKLDAKMSATGTTPPTPTAPVSG